MHRNYKLLQGLPKYFGGKRKIADFIVNKAVGDVFADAFLGAGSVSLFAKAQGYTVYSNDYSFISNCVGKAFIENNSVKIHNEELLAFLYYIYDGDENYSGICTRKYSNIFTDHNCYFIDKSVRYIQTCIKPEVKRNLFYAMLVKYISDLRPFGNFTYENAYILNNPFETEDSWVVHKKLNKYLNYVYSTQYDLFNKIAGSINYSVFSNGKDNRHYRKDIFDFVTSVQADTIYFDPPYFGSNSYDQYYKPLTEILLNKDLVLTNSIFNSRNKYIDALNNMFDLSKHIPLWIVSYHSDEIEFNTFVDIIKKHRTNATTYKIPYKYSVAVRANQKTETVYEWLVTAGK